MANWAYVKNNQIQELHDELPVNWKNVSGLRFSKDNLEYLRGLGWLPVRQQSIQYDERLMRVADYDREIHDTEVIETPVLEPRPTSANPRRSIEFIRYERDRQLSSSDYTQLPDVSGSMTQQQRDAWIQYRQQLRDFPQQWQEDPNLEFPSAPDA